MAYGYTSQLIVDALINAHDRWVLIAVILNGRSNDKHQESGWHDLVAHGIPTCSDRMLSIAHNKVILIDSGTVITGTFNYTAAAETSNTENLVIIRDGPTTVRLEDNFYARVTHSHPFVH